MRSAMLTSSLLQRPMAETERAVIAAMKGQDKGLNAQFTTTPRNSYKDDHIVMVFNPPRYHASGDSCDLTRSHAGKYRKDEMVLAAIFCDGNRLVFAVAASRSPLSSPSDPEFRRFVRELMDYFVPQHSMVDDVPNSGDKD